MKVAECKSVPFAFALDSALLPLLLLLELELEREFELAFELDDDDTDADTRALMLEIPSSKSPESAKKSGEQ